MWSNRKWNLTRRGWVLFTVIVGSELVGGLYLLFFSSPRDLMYAELLVWLHVGIFLPVILQRWEKRRSQEAQRATRAGTSGSGRQ